MKRLTELVRRKKLNELTRPLIYNLYDSPMSGEDIEQKSFELIEREIDSKAFPLANWEIIRRIIHTTADCGIVKDICFSPGAINAGIRALRSGASIYVDSNMIRSGISMARLRSVCPDYSAEKIHCHIADSDIAEAAKKDNLPRSLHAIRKATGILDGAIVAIGNAPVALLELNRMIIEGELKPALVIAMPVGFVHVVESKDELMSLPVEYIALRGRRGGSPLAVSVIHALCGRALSNV